MIHLKWPTKSAVCFIVGTLALTLGLWRGEIHNTEARVSCSNTPSDSWQSELGFLRPGDIVFRKGESMFSAAALALDPQSAFSHVGIVTEADGRILIVHSALDEAPGIVDTVRADVVSRFLAPDRAVAVAVYRLRDEGPEAATKSVLASRIATGFASRQVRFDRAFDLETADAVYCTELIWRAYRSAGVELVSGEIPSISFCSNRRKAILPSTLQSSSKLQLIWLTSERN